MRSVVRDERGRIMKGSPALNPGGRPTMTPEVREVLTSTGGAAAEKLREIITDATAFGGECRQFAIGPREVVAEA